MAIAALIAAIDLFQLISTSAACNAMTALRPTGPQLEILGYLAAIALFLFRIWRLHASIEIIVFTRLSDAPGRRTVTDIFADYSWPAASMTLSSVLCSFLVIVAAYDGILPGLLETSSCTAFMTAWMFGIVSGCTLVFCAKTDVGEESRRRIISQRHARRPRRPRVQYETLPPDPAPPLPPPLDSYVILSSSSDEDDDARDDWSGESETLSIPSATEI